MPFLSSVRLLGSSGLWENMVLAGLGLGCFTVATFVRLALVEYRDEAEVKPVPPKTQYITQDTEDSLKANTLDTLLGHYNFAIRETAAKIVCDRAVNDGSTVETLLWGITQPDYDVRIRNLRCLAIITDHQTLHLLHTWKAYSAIVRSLEYCLDPDQEPLDDIYFDEYYLRDMAEKLCLMFISQLTARYDSDKLIKAKFVEKWLAKQNWGTTPAQRRNNFNDYINRKNNRITDVVRTIQDSRSGRASLERVGLMTPSEYTKTELETGDPQFSVIFSLRTVGQEEEEPGARRSREQSPEEQRLRHRHREAMVLNDGSRPLNSEDIIQRDPGSPP